MRFRTSEPLNLSAIEHIIGSFLLTFSNFVGLTILLTTVRAQIMNRVNNCTALQLIAHSSNRQYKKKPEVEDELAVPYIEFSFYDLTLKRIAVLDCK
jgi:hypothetical protein